LIETPRPRRRYAGVPFAMDDHGITLEQAVAALCRPETYAEAPPRVEVIETHMSFVFLTPSHAYKLKKPVRYDFLDFSTPALRKHDCEEELRLNQRLAAGVYLALVALFRSPEGRLRLGADGDALEWLVQMRRLPQHLMLDEKIRRGTLSERDLEALAARLARFYRSCAPEPMTAAEYGARIRNEIEIDHAALRAHAAALDGSAIDTLHGTQTAFLERHFALLERRVGEGRIIEGHGDLRPEHVCLLDDPVVFDCLEFNRALRIVDAADELAFLAMECERLGAAHAGTRLLKGYAARTGDAAPARLVDFYKSRRASLRARLSILHIGELDRAASARWVAQTGQYLRIALDYAGR